MPYLDLPRFIWMLASQVLEKFAPELVDRLQWSHMRGVPLY